MEAYEPRNFIKEEGWRLGVEPELRKDRSCRNLEWWNHQHRNGLVLVYEDHNVFVYQWTFAITTLGIRWMHSLVEGDMYCYVTNFIGIAIQIIQSCDSIRFAIGECMKSFIDNQILIDKRGPY